MFVSNLYSGGIVVLPSAPHVAGIHCNKERDVEEIFRDLIASETGDVWAGFLDIKRFDELMSALDAYFAAEEKELLGQVPSVNTLMYEYYFSKPEAERIIIMKQAHDTVVSEMAKILGKVYGDKKLSLRMSEHICVVLQGLASLSFSGCISKKIIEEEFKMLKAYMISKSRSISKTGCSV